MGEIMIRPVLIAVAFSVLLLAGCGKPGGTAQNEAPQSAPPAEASATPAAPAAAPAPASDNSAGVPLGQERLAAALKAAGMELQADGLVMNACDEKVKPGVYAADVGGAVGRAYLITMEGGPNMVTCYGDGPGIWLVRDAAGSFGVILQGMGFLAIMPTEHMGVKDVTIGGPGFEFPVFAWNGKTYEPSGTIKDSEMPAPIN